VIKKVFGDPATAVPTITPSSTSNVAVPATVFQPVKSVPLNKFFQSSFSLVSALEELILKNAAQKARHIVRVYFIKLGIVLIKIHDLSLVVQVALH
jgi:hypothetical protein